MTFVPRVAARRKCFLMPKANPTVVEDDFFILSSLPPSRTQRRLAVAVVIGILIVFFIITGPLAHVHPGPLAAFLPAYLTAMFVSDSITAILLFAQFSILRSRAILVIASGYVFTALVLIPYVLTFPDVFVPGGLIGGLQSSAGLYVLWHCGFPLFVLGYALTKGVDPSDRLWKGTVHSGIAVSVGITAALVLAAAVFCIAGEPFLPGIMVNPLRFSTLWPYVVGAPVAFLCICALIVLWIRRRSMLDLWLMVVMSLFLIEVPLSYYPIPIRFSGGWYAVRIIGFVASSLVLIVLLYEITTLYARLLQAVRAQRREREARLITGDAVAATIAHEVKQPLSAMISLADAGLRFLNRKVPGLDEAKEALSHIAAEGHRTAAVIESIRGIFKKGDRTRASLDLNHLITETLALSGADLKKHRIFVGVELDERLPQVSGDRVQLQQVLLNLITNAIESMTAIGGSRVLSVTSRIQDDGDVRISVADTGAGVGPQDIDGIFNPLFTTKADGMGMGLAICRSIIEAHGARLWATPNTPRGAVFHISLVQGEMETFQDPEAQAAAPLRRAGGDGLPG
jgi:signal transduction histidine kinase